MRILIFNVNWRGDVLFSTPAIRAIRKQYPDVYLACIVPPRCRDILLGDAALDEIIIFDEGGLHKGFKGKLKFILTIKKKHFDQAFLFHRSFTRALLVYLAGIPKRIGYATKKRGILLTTKIPPPPKELHKVDYFLGIVKAVGIEAVSKYYEFYIPKDAKDFARNFLVNHEVGEDDFLVVINPGGNWLPKRWPVERYAELGDELAKGYKAKILITGAAKDKGLAQDITRLMTTKPISSCGETTLKELGALLERADLLISGDSGPMHIAVALGTPTIVLFGPTSPKMTGPYGKGKYSVLWKHVGCEVPCYDPACSENRCMKAITVEEVLRVVANNR